MEFNRYRDNYGVWIRTDHETLVEMGFVDEVKSPESRIAVNWVYLYGEDGVRFIRHVKLRQSDVTVIEASNSEESTIRDMAPFRKELVLFEPIPGRVLKLGESIVSITQVSTRGNGRIFLEDPRDE